MLQHALRVTNVLKTLTWVSTRHDTLGKQTGLSRPNDAALCEAAVAAQALLRTSMTNVDVNVSLGLSDKMSDAPSLPSLTETSTLAVCPPLSPLW